MNKIIEKSLENIKKNMEDLNNTLLNLEYPENKDEITKIRKNISQYDDVLGKYDDLVKIEKELEEIKNSQKNESLDKEFKELMKIEHDRLIKEQVVVEEEIMVLLLPKDEHDDKNVYLEIRAGTGGSEAKLFAADIYEMYLKYCASHNWKVEVQHRAVDEQGGYSKIEVLITGKMVYSLLKYESGVHRVQRVPKTESQGRVHTSTISVAIIPEILETPIVLNPTELRIDTYRSSGAGGQHVNTTDSAVRVTHLPTGLVATSQDGRSQHDNKEKAMQNLKSKLHIKQLEEKKEEQNRHRSLAGTGDRSEKIRTYNYPQNRITDHRIGLTLNKLDIIMNDGDLDEIIETLIADDKKKQIEEMDHEDFFKRY